MKRPLLLGHRGARASRHLPENTLASFELCLRHGCDGFEFDVRLSADGQAVICHDSVTGGSQISDSKAADLALPTLEDVLAAFASRAFLDIELKVAGLEKQTVALLRQYPPQPGYVVSSFLPEVLTSIHSLNAGVSLGFLCERSEELSMWRDLPVAWLIPRHDLLRESLIQQAHRAERKVMPWTVNHDEEMRRVADWGVDAIISDETELLARALR